MPPVFDMLKKNSFFKKEEAVINEINNQIEAIENSEAYLKALKHNLYLKSKKIESKLKARRVELKTLKKEKDKKSRSIKN